MKCVQMVMSSNEMFLFQSLNARAGLALMGYLAHANGLFCSSMSNILVELSPGRDNLPSSGAPGYGCRSSADGRGPEAVEPRHVCSGLCANAKKKRERIRK